MFKKNIYKQIYSEIKKAKSILLTFHPSPDGDCIGANLAMYQFLIDLGKKVTLITGDNDLPKNFSSLPATNKITQKNFFKINQDNFDLFLILDIANFNQISKLGEINFSSNLKTIIIDHHFSNPKFAQINLVESESPSTCQIIYEFFKRNKLKITSNVAACLLVGIYTDTGGFKYPNTTYKTFSAATELSKLYPNFNKLIFDIENNESPERIKFLSLILGSVKTYFSDKVAIASVDFQTLKNHNLHNSSVINGSEIANMVKSVTGWEIGVCMIEFQPKTIKVNFRTRDSNKFDLSKIAISLGGGGHQAAAATTVSGKSFDEVHQLLIKNLKKVYPKLN